MRARGAGDSFFPSALGEKTRETTWNESARVPGQGMGLSLEVDGGRGEGVAKVLHPLWVPMPSHVGYKPKNCIPSNGLVSSVFYRFKNR